MSLTKTALYDKAFADVRARLDAAFDSIPTEVIYKCVRHSEAAERLKTYLDELRQADDLNPDGYTTIVSAKTPRAVVIATCPILVSTLVLLMTKYK